MPRNKATRPARQYADTRAGWSPENPIFINDAEAANPGRTLTRTYVSVNPQRKMEHEQDQGINSLAEGAKPSQFTRKRTYARVSEDDENIRQNNTKPFKRARWELVEERAVTGQGQEISQAKYKPSLQASLSKMWKDIDRERDAAKELRRAQEEAQLLAQRDEALETKASEARYRSSMASTLKSMQQEHDRQRKASAELQKAKQREAMAKEREDIEEKCRQERIAEEEKANKRSVAEKNLKSLWQIYDADDRRARTMGAGQLSERGKRRVQERQQAQAQAARRA